MKGNPHEWFLEYGVQLKPAILVKDENLEATLIHLIDELNLKTNEHLSCYISSLASSKKFATLILQSAIELSDSIYSYKLSIEKSIKDTIHFTLLHKYYLAILNQLEAFLEQCGRYNFDILNNLKLTRYSLPMQKMNLGKSLAILAKRLKKELGDRVLREVIISDLSILLHKKEFTRNTATYVSLVMEKLLTLSALDVMELKIELIRLNYNSPGFFCWLTEKSNLELMDLVGIHDKMRILISLEDQINNVNYSTKLKFLKKDESIKEQFISFIYEKKKNIYEILKLKRLENLDEYPPEKGIKQLILSPVAAFAFMIRLFMIEKLIPDTEIKKTFDFFAKYFRTEKTAMISGESLLKKSTDVDFRTAKYVRNILYKMVLWIDEKFNTKNHF